MGVGLYGVSVSFVEACCVNQEHLKFQDWRAEIFRLNFS
jgi:hypothetical protein